MSRDRSRKQSVKAVVSLKDLDDGISNCWENMQDEIVQLTLSYFVLMFRKEERTDVMSLKETAGMFAELNYTVPVLITKMQQSIFRDLENWCGGKKFHGKLGVALYTEERSAHCSNWDKFLEQLLGCNSQTYLTGQLKNVVHCLESLIGLATTYLFMEEESGSDEDDITVIKVVAHVEVGEETTYLAKFKDGTKRAVKAQDTAGMVRLVGEYDKSKCTVEDVAFLKEIVDLELKQKISSHSGPSCSTDPDPDPHFDSDDLEEQEEEVEVELLDEGEVSRERRWPKRKIPMSVRVQSARNMEKCQCE